MAKILLVEDDQFLSSILASSFRDHGHEVICAYDGDSAVARAIERHFDAILLDILLPGKDGFSVLEAVKSLEATRRIPVVVISNLSDEKSVARMKEGGAASYIVKAHTTPQLVLEEVKKVMESADTA
jgi:two-component system, OmpR family, response regulator VicR